MFNPNANVEPTLGNTACACEGTVNAKANICEVVSQNRAMLQDLIVKLETIAQIMSCDTTNATEVKEPTCLLDDVLQQNELLCRAFDRACHICGTLRG